jgi:1,4-dihydroxy-2-naphthoate octaprenyltransferase
MKTTIRYWIDAARPRTLPASISPVLIGTALAWHTEHFRLIPSLLCLAVALFAQIASNFANDYFDFRKGADTNERTGPDRAVSKGWITPKAMLYAVFLMLALTCLCGLGLLYMSDWKLIFVGLMIIIGAMAYSAGPYPLSYHGLGDISVWLFYGLIPVVFTYYVQALVFCNQAWLLGAAFGFLSVDILVVNNYRDYEEDMKVSKRTTIVLFGRGFGRIFYLVNGLFALVLAAPVIFNNAVWLSTLMYIVFLILFIHSWRNLCRLEGSALNGVLGTTARNVLLFAFICIFAMLF